MAADAALDEVDCTSRVPLTLYLMEGVILGMTEGATLGEGTWATCGGSPGGHRNGGSEHVEEARTADRDNMEACTMLSPLEVADVGKEG
jgi:hypothetical protein